MRRVTAMAALILVALATHPMPPQLVGQGSNVEQIVTQRVRGYFAAMGSGNLAVIEQSLAEDYLVIGGDGKLETRPERLAWLRGNAKNLFAVTPTEIRVRSYGFTAVATGLVVIPQDGNTPSMKSVSRKCGCNAAGRGKRSRGRSPS